MNSNDETTKNKTEVITPPATSTEGATPSCCANNKAAVESTTEQNSETTIKDAVTNAVLKEKVKLWKRASAALALLLVVSLAVDFSVMPFLSNITTHVPSTPIALAAEVLPDDGVALPIKWNDLGKQMLDTGVIDVDKFEKLYESRGGMSDETRMLLYGVSDRELRIHRDNAQELLNLLWAFGLGNKSPILETGLMTSYDGKQATSSEVARAKAGRMAATGGWPLSTGNPMDHYSAHEFVVLSEEQWQLVEKIASGIFRPCCNNPTHFPDCNHGMAMLGLIELMVANNVAEDDIWDTALAVNSYWFPDTYLTIAKYKENEQTAWKDVSAEEVLGASYSSGSGYGKIRQAVEPVSTGGGGGCGA